MESPDLLSFSDKCRSERSPDGKQPRELAAVPGCGQFGQTTSTSASQRNRYCDLISGDWLWR